MSETSVDHVEKERANFLKVSRRVQWYEGRAKSSRMRSGSDESFRHAKAHADAAFRRLQAAILSSSPLVQALEAVARAAQGVGGGAECEQRGAEFEQPSWCATHPQEMWPCPYTELNAALAALQEETGRGEDGDGRTTM